MPLDFHLERKIAMNNNTTVSSALYGTKTAENLKNAFSKEAEAFARGSIFTSVALDEGNMSAQRTLIEQADNDKRHAELWLGYLDEIGDTFENLSELASLKAALSGNLYPAMAEIADEEGFDEIAEKMRLVAAVKNSQKQTLDSEAERIASPASAYSDNPETVWHCHCCGYDVKGNTPPDRCPLCSYPTSFFART